MASASPRGVKIQQNFLPLVLEWVDSTLSAGAFSLGVGREEGGGKMIRYLVVFLVHILVCDCRPLGQFMTWL